MPKVSIILVHYREKKVLFDCIKSIYSSKPKNTFEIIVVDNDEIKSVEKILLKKFPRILYVASPGNIGYGSGNNLGVSKAKGKFVFILNPDTIVSKGAIDNLIAFSESGKNIGIVAPLLTDGKGKIYPLQGTQKLTPLRAVFALTFINKIFPNNPISAKYWLKNIDRSKPHEVDVVPGSAFLIKRSLFNKIKGFDENYFLYFEEFDLCNRVKRLGKKIFITPRSGILHYWAVSTPSSPFISKIFAQSRFYYFKKNYGLTKALIVEFFTKINKRNMVLSAILLFGALLRFYNLRGTLIFNGEMGTDYMNVLNMANGERSFLLGPRTSHEWFFIPPGSYWVYYMLLKLSNYDPTIINYFWGLFGVGAIYLSFYYLKKLFGEKTALISSLMLAISPAWIRLARDSRYNAPAGIIFIVYLYYLYKSVIDKGKSLFKLGVVMGLSLNFFPSPILLVPSAIVCFLYFRVMPGLRYIVLFIAGFLIINIPFMIYEFTNRFNITVKIISWIPYRIAGFFGLYPKNNANGEIIYENFYSLYRFIGEQFTLSINSITSLIFLTLIFGSLYLYRINKINKSNVPLSILLISGTVSMFGLFIHGAPPEHYYLVIFPFPLILFSYLITNAFQTNFARMTIIFSLIIAAFASLIAGEWFSRQEGIAYETQIKVAELIKNDSGGKVIKIERIGVNDHFENDFANNYIYLLKVRGVQISDSAKTVYVISEESAKPLKGRIIFSDQNVSVYLKEL